MVKKAILIAIMLLASYRVIAQPDSEVKITPTYSEREVMMQTQTGNLYGTLTIPLENRLGIVALIIPGSGPTDRDGNSPVLQGKNNSLKMLAEGLAAQGVASLRIDKRGIGKSKQAAIAESDMRFEDMVNDAACWLHFLKNDKARFKKIAVIGHSEGSLVGMLAAKEADTEYFISIAGVGRPAYEILEEQLAKQLPPQMMDTAILYINMLKGENSIENPNPLLASLFRTSVQPYMISWFKYNPAKEVAKLKSNILLIQGTTDIQVNIADVKLLAAGNSSAKVVTIDGMNHVLKQVEGGLMEQLPSYNNPDLPLADGLIESIADFLTNGK